LVKQNIISLIFDCDETLCFDTTDFVLLELDQDLVSFWSGVSSKVKRGWDPPLAYMTQFMDVVKKEKPNLTVENLKEIGKKIKLYDGVEEMLIQLRQIIKKNKEYQEAEVKLEYYVISGGFEPVIKASKIKDCDVQDVFGCNFATDKKGKLLGPKSTISFTEKTRFLYAINKGVPGAELRKEPSLVNQPMDGSERRIPFSNMIYLGDGFSDIPCFSMLEHNGGVGVGVFTERAYRRGYELAISRRIMAGPYKPDYRKGTDVRLFLEERIRALADSVAEKRMKELGIQNPQTRGQTKLEDLRAAAERLDIDLHALRIERQRRLGRALFLNEETKLIQSEIKKKRRIRRRKV
jgi:hypothetical protein